MCCAQRESAAAGGLALSVPPRDAGRAVRAAGVDGLEPVLDLLLDVGVVRPPREALRHEEGVRGRGRAPRLTERYGSCVRRT